MGNRIKLFSVGIADCHVETFTVGGRGGSGKDTSNTGVRITHPPSGAVGIGVRTRSQSHNKQAAFRGMAESNAFIAWARLVAAEMSTGKTLEQRVEEDMTPEKLKVEVKDDAGRWVVLCGK